MGQWCKLPYKQPDTLDWSARPTGKGEQMPRWLWFRTCMQLGMYVSKFTHMHAHSHVYMHACTTTITKIKMFLRSFFMSLFMPILPCRPRWLWTQGFTCFFLTSAGIFLFFRDVIMNKNSATFCLYQFFRSVLLCTNIFIYLKILFGISFGERGVYPLALWWTFWLACSFYYCNVIQITYLPLS